ncbi:DNA-binding transcriptional regulator GbsR (MarR family) [Paenibacillus shirakamiensis]|uniref:HTH-type transcriptional regulator n=1 Tax=Paenibacillus shirakamiensis TaxID=1265935 RepID=A0ABS4JG28_9BACL|nr:GbsR/MarR family transcriptional regulator [Paenibacillus shirakamiensis]MBP2000657.1 DNA-binding transcriptional regulator GbsR (MarR family) [Paenibacillus shirakamiensis]
MSLNQLTEQEQLDVQKIRKRVIEAIGRNMDLYGVTLSTGHLYGLLFFADKPMTLDEMGEEMKMSKTSMSTGVRTLLDLKMVNKVWEKGSRKDLYEVEFDWYQTFHDFFSTKWRNAVETNLSVLQRSIEEIDRWIGQQSEENVLSVLKEDKRKMKEAVQYYEWLDRLIDTMESGDIYKLVPKVDHRQD